MTRKVMFESLNTELVDYSRLSEVYRKVKCQFANTFDPSISLERPIRETGNHWNRCFLSIFQPFCEALSSLISLLNSIIVVIDDVVLKLTQDCEATH